LITAPTDRTFVQLDVGTQHACGVDTDGSVVCWGEDDGDRSAAPDGLYVEVACGANFTCALSTTGELTCWGYDDLGQSSPPSGAFESVRAGRGRGHFACALDPSGAAQCWGQDSYTQTQPPPASAFVLIAPGTDHACGITTAEAVCWGNAEQGATTIP
jgi:alpha-tubulin suppressor-like RCC1 family protein